MKKRYSLYKQAKEGLETITNGDFARKPSQDDLQGLGQPKYTHLPRGEALKLNAVPLATPVSKVAADLPLQPQVDRARKSGEIIYRSLL